MRFKKFHTKGQKIAPKTLRAKFSGGSPKPKSERVQVQIGGGIPDPGDLREDLDYRIRKYSPAEKKVQRLMSRRTAREQKPYTTRISYNRCTQQYTGGADVAVYGGSTFNRKKPGGYRPWSRRMNRQLSRWAAGHRRTRDEMIVWQRVGDHEIRGSRTYSWWNYTDHRRKDGQLTAYRKTETIPYKKTEPGICIMARQKIYAALSAGGFEFLPDVIRPAVKHYFSADGKNLCQERAKAFWRVTGKGKTFATFTFIEHVDDKLGSKIWNKFLTVARRENPGLACFKVAEHQPENPLHTIHFHVIFDRFMDVIRYNSLWALQQYNEGLRGHRAIDGSEITMAEFVDHYNAGTVQEVLGPFQIEPAKTINALAAYLIKYVSKTDEKEVFGCRVWNCSHKISKLFFNQVTEVETYKYLRRPANYQVNRQTRETGECAPPIEYSGAFFSVIKVHNPKIVLPILKPLELINQWIYYDGFIPDRIPRISETDYRRLFIQKARTARQLRYEIEQLSRGREDLTGAYNAALANERKKMAKYQI